jgi:predicted type IV restriction endonuclease
LLKKFYIVICEAKNGKDVVDAIPQNGAQLVASREIYRQKKRMREDISREFLEEMDKLTSYGIVTTGHKWIFISYHKENEEWKLAKSQVYNLFLSVNPESNTVSEVEKTILHDHVQLLLKIVAGIIKKQKEEVELFEKFLQQLNANKKSRTGSVELLEVAGGENVAITGEKEIEK